MTVLTADRPESSSRVMAAAASLLCLYIGTAQLVGGGIVDDAYIFLRYVRNIWAGLGPVFNAGERVEGYTSPLWLAILSTLWPLPLSAPQIAVGASAICGFGLVLVLLRKRTQPVLVPAALGGLLLATNPPFVYWALSGMDSALFALLFVVSVLVFERDLEKGGGFVRSGVSLSLAACARLEALWLVPLFAFLIWRRPGSPAAAWQRLLTLATPIVAVHGIHFLWRHSYYGTWLPNTFAAKVGVPRDVLFEHGFSYVSAFSFQAAPFFVLLVVCFRRLTRLERNEVLVPVAILIWWTAFVCVVGGDHFAFYRFFVPVFGLFAVLLTRISGAVLRRSQTRLKHAGLIAATALALNAWILFGPQTEPARSEVVQARAWARTGQWCASELPPGSVATLVAGAIPFYCDRETYDLLGLVDRHVATQGTIVPDAAVGHQKYDTPYILSREPKYIFFSMSGLLLRPLMESVENRRKLPGRTNQALIDLVTHPEVLAAYAYRAEPLGDGTWVEFLERRPIAVQRHAAGETRTTH